MMDLPAPPSFRLDGRRALVAGASSGIGLACAVALAAAGARVILAARGAEVLTQAAEAMTAQGWHAEALGLDIADLDATRAVLTELGALDVVVNSAGLARHSPALDATPASFDAVMAVNLRGAFFLATEAARAMIAARRPGSIITISSQMGHVGGLDRAVYCASKHAVEGFTKSMAIEWGKSGVRINTVCPTFIRTPLTEGTFADPARRDWLMSKIKLGRPGETTDVGGAVLYLASDAAALVTGSALMVDGGWTAG